MKKKKVNHEKCPKCQSSGTGGSYGIENGMRHIRTCQLCGHVWQWDTIIKGGFRW